MRKNRTGVRLFNLAAALTLLASCASGDPPGPAAATPEPQPAGQSVPASPSPVPVRSVGEQPFSPFATVGGVTLVHPSRLVERVAFHQSNHDGARQMDLTADTVAPVTLESRTRGTASRTAADVVSNPTGEIRAVVTGTVVRGGSYTLYCDYTDFYVVIEPDAHPGWEVKMLHLAGITVSAGERVFAGQTRVAPRPAQLAFESQVDELTNGGRAWPHIHIEVVDPSIPDRRTPGGGCD